MQAEYGAMPVLSDPTKASDAQYHYAFTGWSPAVSTVYGNQTYTAQFERTLRQYTVTWVVDGSEEKQTYDYGALPVYDGTPTKESDPEKSYTFSGWDKELSPVTGDATYTAVFHESKNCYNITFVVNGTEYEREYEYGAIPAFEGDTSKPMDEDYRYVFTGWDKEIVAVTAEATYTAQYESVPVGSATIVNTMPKVAWGCDFTTAVSLKDVKNMTSTKITLYYDHSIVTLKSYEACEGVTVTGEGQGYLTMEINGLSDAAEIISVTFTVSQNAPFGQSVFMEAMSEDKIVSGFEKLTVYQLGDVDMNGAITKEDALAVQRYAVKKQELDSVQTVYADVNGDGKVNTLDGAMILRFVGGSLSTLGNRITLTLHNGELTTVISLEIGSELEENHGAQEGFAWSFSPDEYQVVDFTDLTENTDIYLVSVQ